MEEEEQGEDQRGQKVRELEPFVAHIPALHISQASD